MRKGKLIVRLKAFFLSSAFVLPIAHLPIAAWAQHAPDAATRTRARANFQSGVAAYTRGNYSAALESFLAAYRLAPHPTVRVNIANCYMQLHQPVDALTYFEAFLVESPDAPPAQRGDVQHQIEELRGQVAEVHVGLSPDGVRDPIVSVDGHATAISNVVRMMPGHHVVETSAEGFQPERSEIDATPGMRHELVVRLRPTGSAATNTAVAVAVVPPVAPPVHNEPVAAPPPTVTPTQVTPVATATPMPTPTPVEIDHPRSDGSRTLSPVVFYAGAGVTAAALISWASFGIAALVNYGAYQHASSSIQMGVDVQHQMDLGYGALTNTNTFSAIADVSLIVTVLAAGTTVFLFTRTRFDNRPAVAVAPMAGNGLGGVVVGGSF